jgi:hypothetical protein
MAEMLERWIERLFNYFGFYKGEDKVGELTFQQRKTINIGWDTAEITGATVSLKADNPDDDSDAVEVRNVVNDGWATITFPQDYTGTCNVTVEGSDGGSQDGTVTVV